MHDVYCTNCTNKTMGLNMLSKWSSSSAGDFDCFVLSFIAYLQIFYSRGNSIFENYIFYDKAPTNEKQRNLLINDNLS